jgi:hypothetical protein
MSGRILIRRSYVISIVLVACAALLFSRQYNDGELYKWVSFGVMIILFLNHLLFVRDSEEMTPEDRQIAVAYFPVMYIVFVTSYTAFSTTVGAGGYQIIYLMFDNILNVFSIILIFLLTMFGYYGIYAEVQFKPERQKSIFVYIELILYILLLLNFFVIRN